MQPFALLACYIRHAEWKRDKALPQSVMGTTRRKRRRAIDCSLKAVVGIPSNKLIAKPE
jgi:hypothetical protein